MEISLVAQPEQNQLERAQVSEEEGRVVPKCKCLALKSPSACEEMEGPGELHPVTPQTTAGGISDGDEGNIFVSS